MKNFFFILMGFLGFAFVVAIGVTVFFLMPQSSNVPSQVALPTPTEQPHNQDQPPDFAEGKTYVDFEATIHVPEPLKHLVTSRGVVLTGSILKFENVGAKGVGEWADLFDLAPNPTAPFPRKVRFHTDKEKLLKIIGSPTFPMFLRIDGCFDSSRNPCFPAMQPRMNLRIVRKLTETEYNSGKPVQLGDLYFTRDLQLGHAIPGPGICEKPISNVTGKVTPTAEFLAKLPKDKKAALFIVPGLLKGHMAGQAVRKEKVDLWPWVYHAEYFTPSEKAHAYSFPQTKISVPDQITGFVALCDEKEDLRSCGNAHFPGYYPVSDDGLGFQLVPEGLKFKYCDSANFLLHSFPAVKEGDKPVLGKSRNAALPAEIVEGQLL